MACSSSPTAALHPALGGLQHDDKKMSHAAECGLESPGDGYDDGVNCTDNCGNDALDHSHPLDQHHHQTQALHNPALHNQSLHNQSLHNQSLHNQSLHSQSLLHPHHHQHQDSQHQHQHHQQGSEDQQQPHHNHHLHHHNHHHHHHHHQGAAPLPTGHRRNAPSHDSISRQSIIKALASVARKNKPQALSLDKMLSSATPHHHHHHHHHNNNNNNNNNSNNNNSNNSNSNNNNSNNNASAPPPPPPGSAASSQRLADALQDLARRQSTPLTALTALQSPCFYHERFDDAVDIQKVLDDITNDESMSHSRLVQTATGVREVSKQLQRRPIRRAVRNVMIVTKARDNQLVYLTRELALWLLRTPRYGASAGVNVYVDAKLRTSHRFDAAGLVAHDARFHDMLKYWTPDLCWTRPETFDLVLTLGGDGTVLFTSWLFQRVVPPVLSFSLGSLGFMTTFDFDHYQRHLARVMGPDGMKINLRMRFTCTVWRYRSPLAAAAAAATAADDDDDDDDDNVAHSRFGSDMHEGEQFEVLNELVIDRGPSPYVSNLELYGDDELLTVVQADGCIFSTPTGSTAYSLSAGGSLVHPDIPAILLTPICPHTLSFRPMVLSDTMALRVAVPRNSRATAYCAFDGKGRIELRKGDHVTITASQYPFPTVTRTDTEWFDSISRTLRWNVRAADQKPFDVATLDDDDADCCWDIDTDSAYYPSEEGSVSASPVRRQMAMLAL